MANSIDALSLYKEISQDQLAQIIDVRSDFEFKAKRIDGSINIPLPIIEANLNKINQDKPCYLICRSGKRAELAKDILIRHGFKPIVLAGGIMSYDANKLPLINKTAPHSFSIEQQVQIMVGSLILIGVFVRQWQFLVIVCGIGLLYTGLTGSCLLGKILMRAPWNNRNISQNCNG